MRTLEELQAMCTEPLHNVMAMTFHNKHGNGTLSTGWVSCWRQNDGGWRRLIEDHITHEEFYVLCTHHKAIRKIGGMSNRTGASGPFEALVE